MVRFAAWVASLLLIASGPASRVRADLPDCEVGRFHEAVDVDVRPGYGAGGVALDAPVVVRYLETVDLDELEASLLPGDALVSLLRDRSDGPREVVAGHVERLDASTVTFVPARPLAPRTTYRPLVAKPGFDAPAFAELRFETGSAADTEPPDFPAGEDGIAIATERVDEACGGPPGKWRVQVTVPAATDDGDDGSIEYFLYLTRAVGVAKPELRDRARGDGGDVRMELILDPEQSREVACVSVRVVDGVGRMAEAEPEVCFEPIDGSFFEACALARGAGATASAAGGARSGGGALIACLAALVLRWRSRRRAG